MRFTVIGLALAVMSLAMPAQPTAHEHTPPEPFHYSVPEGEPLSGLKICVDPGHGGQVWGSTRGYTGGTKSAVSNHTESEANLRCGMMLWNLLTQAGADVVMTRTFETRLSADCPAEPGTPEYNANRREELNVRVRVAENNDCDLLVSIHHNAVGNSDVNVTTGFYFDPEQYDGELDIEHTPENVALSRELCQRVIDNFEDRLEIGSRPARHGDFHLIRETKLPAILVECSFMTNPEEAERLENLHRSRLEAIAIFEGILAQYTEEAE